MDCVLNNLNEEWIKRYNKMYCDKLTLEDIKCWDMDKYVKPECGRAIYDILMDISMFRDLIPIEGSIEYTEKLSQEHDLYIITATHHSNVAAKVEWLQEYFPHISVKNFITCYDKSLVNVDLLIDDGGHNIESFPNRTIVLDYAWNRYLDRSYPRAYTWKDVYNIVNEMGGNKSAS